VEHESITLRETDSIQDKQYSKVLETELQSLTLLNNKFLKKIKALQRENEYLNTQIRALRNIDKQHSENNKKGHSNKNKQGNEIDIFQNSYSFRIGEAVVMAVSKPGKNSILKDQIFKRISNRYTFSFYGIGINPPGMI